MSPRDSLCARPRLRRAKPHRCVAAFATVVAFCMTLARAQATPTTVPPAALHKLHTAYDAMLSGEIRVSPTELADGARTGIAAELYIRGIDTTLPFTPHGLDARGAKDIIDALIAKSLSTYGGRLDRNTLVDMAIEGEVAVLGDRNAALLTAKQLAGRRAGLENAKVGGIGANTDSDPEAGRWFVRAIAPGGAAERAGIRVGDAITSFDGKSIRAFPNPPIASHGNVGSIVRVTLERNGATLRFAFPRSEIFDPNLVSEPVSNATWAMRFAPFDADAGLGAAGQVDRIARCGSCALLIDLRGVDGGTPAVATRISSLFVPAGALFSTSHGGSDSEVTATGDARFKGNVGVLVDERTASAAEAIAAALQAHGAKVIGKRTAGEGLIYGFYRFADGTALRIGTAQYRTTLGQAIERVGITPDVVVNEPGDPQLAFPRNDPILSRAIDETAQATSIANGQR